MSSDNLKPQPMVEINSQPVRMVTKAVTHEQPSHTFFKYLIIFLGCSFGIIVSQIILEMLRQPPQPPKPQPQPQPYVPSALEEAKRRAAEKIANPHLAWAKEECDKATDHNIQAVKDLFEHSKTKTRGYTDYALGMYSKWLAVKEFIPFTSKDHGPYLKSEFEKQVLSPIAIERAINECVKNHIKSIRDIESQMLVRIKKDAPNYPELKSLEALDVASLQANYEKIVEEASKKAVTESVVDAGRLLASEVASFIAIKVAAAIAAKMTTTGVIAGIATTTGIYTLGISIIAGIVVDQIVSWVWDWYADPKGNLAKKLNETLDQMCEGAIDGTEKEPGLRKALNLLNANRAKLQKTATIDLLLQ
ncbi:MAG: hypothetical protein ACKO26_24600 [Planctomycetota bacterium]